MTQLDSNLLRILLPSHLSLSINHPALLISPPKYLNIARIHPLLSIFSVTSCHLIAKTVAGCAPLESMLHRFA